METISNNVDGIDVTGTVSIEFTLAGADDALAQRIARSIADDMSVDFDVELEHNNGVRDGIEFSDVRINDINVDTVGFDEFSFDQA